jgi:hypothetical protein
MDASVLVVVGMTSRSEKGRSGVEPEGSAEMDVGRLLHWTLCESRWLRRGVVLVLELLLDRYLVADLCGCMVQAIEIVLCCCHRRGASCLVEYD